MGVRGCGSVGVRGCFCTRVMGRVGVLVRTAEREKGLGTDEWDPSGPGERGAQYEVYRLASAYHSCISRTIHVIPTVVRGGRGTIVGGSFTERKQRTSARITGHDLHPCWAFGSSQRSHTCEREEAPPRPRDIGVG